MIIELVAILVFAGAMWWGRQQGLHKRPFSHLDPVAVHHAYLGVILFGFGWCWGIPPLQWAGQIITIDDAFQHTFQAITRRVGWRSPLNRLYGALAQRWPLLQRVNQWLDEH